MKKIITQAERTILVNSNAIEAYPKFKELLIKHDFVTDQMIDNHNDMDESTYTLLKTDAYREIFSAAEQEWIAESNFDIDNKRCSLCHHINHRIYYIKNLLNGNVLNVGSDCILHFSNLKNDKNIDMAQQVKLDNQLAKRVIRREQFSSKFPKFISKINSYNIKLEKSAYLVNAKIYNKALKLINEAQELRKNFLNGKGNLNILDDIEVLINQIDNIITVQIPDCNKILSNNKFACTLEIVEWLNLNRKSYVIEKIRNNNSCITIDTINEIAYTPFISSFLNNYKNKTKHIVNDLRIVNSNGNNMIYTTFKNKHLQNITFYCTPDTFMKKIGDIIFLHNTNDDRLTFSFFISKIFKLDNDEENITDLYLKLNSIFRDDYEFIFDFLTNTTYIINKNEGKYTTSSGIENIRIYLLKYLAKNSILYFSNNNYFSRLKWHIISSTDLEVINKCRKSFYPN